MIVNGISPATTINIINGRGVEKNITKTKVSEALDKYLIMRKRTKEYATYDLDFHMAKHIKGYIGARYIDELTREDMQTLLFVVAGYDLENEEDDIDCDNMVSESLLKSVRLLLKQFMDFAVEHKYVSENLAEKLQLPKCKKTDKDSKFLNKVILSSKPHTKILVK